MSFVWRLGSKHSESPEPSPRIFFDDTLLESQVNARLLRRDANNPEIGSPFWRVRAATDGIQATMIPIAISIGLNFAAIAYLSIFNGRYHGALRLAVVGRRETNANDRTSIRLIRGTKKVNLR